jgi:hypothetical protein
LATGLQEQVLLPPVVQLQLQLLTQHLVLALPFWSFNNPTYQLTVIGDVAVFLSLLPHLFPHCSLAWWLDRHGWSFEESATLLFFANKTLNPTRAVFRSPTKASGPSLLILH